MATDSNFDVDNELRQYNQEQRFKRVNGNVRVRDVDTLPDASGGEIPLEDNTAYYFDQPIQIQPTLRLGSTTPIIGPHGGLSIITHTGTGPALKTDGEPFFLRNVTVTSQNGPMFDLSADDTTEMLVESCSFIGTPDFGTIDGYRVPTFKGSNFESFGAGMTFTGQCDKIFFSECPFRNVTGSNVTIITYDSNFTHDITDITDCYVKGVNADTEVIHVEVGGGANDIFQYRGVTHDNSITESNILTGQAAVDTVGYRVRDSYPLPDSGTIGQITLDSTSTIVGSGSQATEIDGSFTLGNSERTSITNGNRIRYDGKKRAKEVVHGVASVSGANTEFELSIGKNGSQLPETASQAFNPNSSTAASGMAIASLKLDTGDSVSLFLENVGGAGDLDVESMTLAF